MRRTGAALDNLPGQLGMIRRLIPARPPLGALIDLREAPMNNDPDFEQRVMPTLHAFYARFTRVALVVRTMSGRMQLNRQVREYKLRNETFSSEPEAIAFLKSPSVNP